MVDRRQKRCIKIKPFESKACCFIRFHCKGRRVRPCSHGSPAFKTKPRIGGPAAGNVRASETNGNLAEARGHLKTCAGLEDRGRVARIEGRPPSCHSAPRVSQTAEQIVAVGNNCAVKNASRRAEKCSDSTDNVRSESDRNLTKHCRGLNCRSSENRVCRARIKGKRTICILTLSQNVFR